MTEASDNEIPEKKKKEEEEEESTLSVVVGNQGLTATTSSSSATASTAAAAAAAAAANSSATTTGKDTTDLDFVGTSHAVKKLFSIPYHSSNQLLCIAVHNLDGTLLIDDTVTAEEAEQQGLFTTTTTTTPVGLPPSIQSLALALTPPKPPSPTHLSATSPSQQQQQQQQSEAISLLSKLIQNVRLHEEQKFSETNSSGDVLLGSKAVAEYLEWNFQGMNMLLGSDASIVRTNNNSQNNSSEKAVAIRVEQMQHLKNLLAENQQPNTNPILQQQQQQPQRSYA